MNDDITALRKQINLLDEQLVRLLNERAAVAVEIGRLKAAAGVQPYDPARERAVLEHIVGLNKGPLGKGDIEDIFATIITACREIQSR